jgi:hypothetical protein
MRGRHVHLRQTQYGDWGARTRHRVWGAQGGSVCELGVSLLSAKESLLSAKEDDEHASADDDGAHQDNGAGTKELGHCFSP